MGRGAGKLLQADLRDFTSDDLFRECPELKHGCDLIIGGPPCQGFSAHRLRNAGVGDPRNSLLLHYFDLVAKVKPSLFLIENVPGLLWPKHASWLKRFNRMATECGYTLSDPVVLNAADYGIPQRRKRVFIIGKRRDFFEISFPPPRTHGGTKSSPIQGLSPWVSCAAAFKKASRQDINNVHMRHNEELIQAFEATPKRGGSRRDSGRILECHRDHDGHSDVYGRIDPRLPAPTMTTACINPSKGRFVHPVQNHGITIRQAARIQTFPDWFFFDGGLMASGQQVGNAVPPTLSKILLADLSNQLRRLYSSAGCGQFIDGQQAAA